MDNKVLMLLPSPIVLGTTLEQAFYIYYQTKSIEPIEHIQFKTANLNFPQAKPDFYSLAEVCA